MSLGKLPAARSREAPKEFRGKNLERFLRQIDSLIQVHGLSNADTFSCVSWYLGPYERPLWEGSQQWGKVWKDFQEEIRYSYNDDDEEMRKCTEESLRQYVKRKRHLSTRSELETYFAGFNRKAAHLIKKKRINSDERDKLFWHGIKKPLRDKVIERYVAKNPKTDLSKAISSHDGIAIIRGLYPHG